MSIRNLSHLFEPTSVALIGASSRPRSVGATILRNLIEAKFAGPVWLVNPKHQELSGLAVYPNVAALPDVPDLAVICTPPATIPGLIAELGTLGTKAAIVISAGLGATRDAEGVTLSARMLAAAKPHLLRVLGPNCVGLLVPHLKLDASFAHTDALPGKIAFVSQSGALVTAVLDWAKSRGIGFSRFISLGDSADVDAGDVLDFLARDVQTHAILMYLEGVTSARKFMSAARAAARIKPVVVLKAGRVAEGAKAAASHTGALAGSDDVYDAAIRRAGMLRVYSTGDLFDAVETLARARPLAGATLTIVTNGGGPGVMATDALVSAHGQLAVLPATIVDELNTFLPPTWSKANPVDIIGDAPVERYVLTMQTLLDSAATDAILFIHAPTAIVPSAEIATALVPIITASRRNVLSCWLGGEAVERAASIFEAAGLPTYQTPEEGTNAFMQIVQYRRNQQLLLQVPTAGAPSSIVRRGDVRAIIDAALATGRSMLSAPLARAVLAAYGIPVVQSKLARSAEEAASMAGEIGFPVALKLVSPDVTHKSDVGGVMLDLHTAAAVQLAATSIEQNLRNYRPDAGLEGFSVEQMVPTANARELIIGVATDAVFGPVILFGQGGTAVEVTADRAIALPPLNDVLARDLIGRTRVSRLLAGYRDRAPVDMNAVVLSLTRLSQLIADFPEIIELDVNPLVASDRGVVALDARIRLAPLSEAGVDRFAIRPYPKELEETIEWRGEGLLLRPIRPEDAAQHLAFFNALDPEDVRLRFFHSMAVLDGPQVARLTQIDYDREMAFIAVRVDGSGHQETLGVARSVADPDNVEAEFAVTVRSDLKGKGLGTILFSKLIAYCRSRGTEELVGEALADNVRMIQLARSLGFEVAHPEPGAASMRLRLTASVPTPHSHSLQAPEP